MNAYSRDLRAAALAAVDRGDPRAQVVVTFGISLATLKRWLHRRRVTGAALPRPIAGRPAVLGAALDAGLVDHLRVHPDATIADHCTHWAAAGGPTVSAATMRRAIVRLGWTRKKRA